MKYNGRCENKMILVDGNNIRISKGDTLDITFELEGYSLKPTDTVTFTIKKELFNDSFLVQKELTELEGVDIHIIIPKEEMKNIPTGTNYYDLMCISDEKRVTFNFPAKIFIERTVHNV